MADFSRGMILMWCGRVNEVPSGWALCDGRFGAPDLRGKFIKGWEVREDIGATGGSATHAPGGTLAWPAGVPTTASVSGGTPAGSVSAPTISWPAGVPTIGAYTPAGTNATSTVTPTGTIAWPAGVPTFSGTNFTTSAASAGVSFNAVTSTKPAGTIAWPAGVPTFTGASNTVGAQTFTGTAWTPPAISWPAGVPTNSTPSFTGSALDGHAHTISWPAGVPTLTGSSQDTQPPYYKLAFIMKL